MAGLQIVLTFVALTSGCLAVQSKSKAPMGTVSEEVVEAKEKEWVHKPVNAKSVKPVVRIVDGGDGATQVTAFVKQLPATAHAKAMLNDGDDDMETQDKDSMDSPTALEESQSSQFAI